jgi:protein phosphatase
MIRTLNEDSLLLVESSRILQSISQPLGVYIIADGMGGHSAGEIASTTIVNAIAQKTYTELLPADMETGTETDNGQWLLEAVQAANEAVFSIRKSTGSDLGSTLVAALIEGNNAHIANVGDSRAYLINAKGIRQITTDHSLVERLVATGQITREEARYHHQRNVIYRTIGDKAIVDIDMNSLPLSHGDRLLLCSDGLSGMITDEDIQRIVEKAPSTQAACDALVDAANAAGGEDNITVIIVEIITS